MTDKVQNTEIKVPPTEGVAPGAAAVPPLARLRHRGAAPVTVAPMFAILSPR